MAEEIDYQNEIRKCCKRLRLSVNLAEHSGVTEGDTNQEYLYHLLSAEVEYRRKLRISKLISAAKFPRLYEFSQFRPDEVEFQDTTLEELQALEFHQEHKNIIMYGCTGTGKTMLSICIGLAACRSEIPVRFFRTAGLINQFSEAKELGQLRAFKKKLSKAKILILDEFGYVPYDRTGAQLFFDYISEVEDEKEIILNTNLEFSRWVNVLYDEQMTAALVGRLTHHCHLLLFPGQNNRLRESSINEIYSDIAAKSQNDGSSEPV